MRYTLDLAKVHFSPGKGCPALALSAEGGVGQGGVGLGQYGHGYYGVKLMGYQDTVYTHSGNQVYANSYIDGVWYVSSLPPVPRQFLSSILRDFANCELTQRFHLWRIWACLVPKR